jgi:uncharacterized protein YacL
MGVGPVLVAIIYVLANTIGMGNLYTVLLPWATFIIYLFSAIITGVIFLILSTSLTDKLFCLIKSIDKWFSALPSSVIFPGTLGLIVGLIISFLLTGLIKWIPISWLSAVITIIVYIVFCYFGVSVAIKRKSELHRLNFLRFLQKEKDETEGVDSCKILDTSVIIDGRIFDLCKTGFIEGTIVVPEFVLNELRHIADSPDDLKRIKGRRGLDILTKIQKELEMPIDIMHTEYDEEIEVDSRLLRLAKDIGGKILTIDYNLNKVATVQDISVLNINELANAVKPVLLAGEEISVKIMREGKEPGQGVAYLDDGTMIVVEGAAPRLGEDLRVEVRSVLQTAAGRMIFGKIKDEK